MLQGKNTIKLLAILGVMVAVYAIVKFTSGTGRSKSYRDVLVEIDTAKVTKVEITAGNNTTTLEKSDGQWQVNGGKQALASVVKSMLSSLQTVEPSRLASRSKDTWKDMQVDSSGTRIQVYQGSNEALDLILGRFGVEGQRSYYTYVRLEEDEDTYVANNFMAMSIGKSPEDYRNNRVLKLKKDSIQSIDFNYTEGTYTLEKSDNGWMMAGVKADSANTASFLNGLSFITSKKFEDGEVGSSDKSVTIHLGGEDITISSFGESILNSSYSPQEYFNDKTVYDKIFKSPDYFMGE